MFIANMAFTELKVLRIFVQELDRRVMGRPS